MAFQLWQKRDTKGWVESKVGWRILSNDLRIISNPLNEAFFLRHMIIHGHLISLNRGCIVFCCRDFLEVFLTDDTRPTWSSEGTLFPVKQSFIPIQSHGCHNPHGEYPPLPFSNAMFPGKQHHDLLVDPFLFSSFPSHTVAATHL